MGDKPKQASILSRQYLAWFTSDTATDLTRSLTTLAQPLVLFAISGSIVTAGTVNTLVQLCGIACALLGGTFVDRHDRLILMACNAGLGLVFWSIVLVLMLSGELTLWAFVPMLVAATMARGLLSGASDAALRSIVSPQQYPKAKSVSEGRDATVELLGGPLGGFLYGLASWLPYLGTVLLYAVGGIFALRLRALMSGKRGKGSKAADIQENQETQSLAQTQAEPQPQTKSQSEHNESVQAAGSFFQDMVFGFTWMFRRYRLPLLALLLCLFNLPLLGIQLGGELQLVSTKAPSFLIGCFNAALGLSALVGSFAANRLVEKIPTGTALLICFAVPTLATLPMVVSDSYLTIFISVSLAMFMVPLLNSSLQGFIFAKTPNELQGRIIASVGTIASLIGACASSIASLLITHFGFKVFALVMALISAFVLLLATLSKRIRDIPAPDHWQETTL